MCKKLEDILSVYNDIHDEIAICEVIGKDEVVEYCDEYNGYYDMYSVRTIEIIKKLTRENIINIILNTYEDRIKRFISLYKLNDEELSLLRTIYENNDNIISFIEYLQKNKLDTFKKKILTIKAK